MIEDRDINEDFECGYCCKEVSERVLFCSQECSDKFDNEILKDEVYEA